MVAFFRTFNVIKKKKNEQSSIHYQFFFFFFFFYLFAVGILGVAGATPLPIWGKKLQFKDFINYILVFSELFSLIFFFFYLTISRELVV